MIYNCAVLGKGTYIGPFCVIGVGPGGVGESDRPTTIGESSVLRGHVTVYGGVGIGSRFQAGHGVLIREDTIIGDDVSVDSGSVIEHHVRIASRARLHSNVFVPEFTVIEEDAWLGPNVVCTNAKYPQSPDVKEHLVGSVVTRDVPGNAVVAGNPARILKSLEDLPYQKALRAAS